MVIEELKIIAKAMVPLSLITIIICYFLQQLDYTFIIGIVIGCLYSLANFYLIGLSVEQAVQIDDQKEMANYMTKQYAKRYILTALVITISSFAGFINPFGVVIPLFFPKMAIYFKTFFGKEVG